MIGTLTILSALKCLNRTTLRILAIGLTAALILFGVAIVVTATNDAMTVTINLGYTSPSR